MKIREAVIGSKVGRLTILSLLEQRSKHGRLLAKCLCDCGKEINALVGNIGVKTISCGCFRAESIAERCRNSIDQQYATKIFYDVSARTHNIYTKIANTYGV